LNASRRVAISSTWQFPLGLARSRQLSTLFHVGPNVVPNVASFQNASRRGNFLYGWRSAIQVRVPGSKQRCVRSRGASKQRCVRSRGAFEAEVYGRLYGFVRRTLQNASRRGNFLYGWRVVRNDSFVRSRGAFEAEVRLDSGAFEAEVRTYDRVLVLGVR
jgi:ribosome modulation factor